MSMETPQNGAQQGGIQHEDNVWSDPDKAGKATLDALEAYLQAKPLELDATPEAPVNLQAQTPKKIPVMSVRSFEDLGHLGIQTVEASSAPVVHEEVEPTPAPLEPVISEAVPSTPETVEEVSVAEVAPAAPASSPELAPSPVSSAESKEDPTAKEISAINETLTSKLHDDAREARRTIREIERAAKRGEVPTDMDRAREKEAKETLDRYMSAVGRARKHVALFDVHEAGGVVPADLVGAFEKASALEDEDRKKFLKYHTRRMFTQALETQGFSRGSAESLFSELISQSREASKLSELLAREGDAYRLRKTGHHANVLRWQGISIKDIDPNAPVPKEIVDALARTVEKYQNVDTASVVDRRKSVAAAREAYRKAHAPVAPEVAPEAVSVPEAAEAAPTEIASPAAEAAPLLGEDLEVAAPTEEDIAAAEARERLAEVEESEAQKDDMTLLETEAYGTVPGYAYGEDVVLLGAGGRFDEGWKVVAMKKESGMVVVRKGPNRREVPLADLNQLNEVSSDATSPEEHLERSAEEEHLRTMALEYDESMRRLEAMLPDAERKGAVDLARSVEEALAKREAEYRDAVLAYKAEHAEARTGGENEKRKLERWYDHMIAESEEKGDAAMAEHYKQRKADYLTAAGGTIVAAGAAAASPEAPSVPAEAFAGPIDPEILARAEKEFKFSKEELEAVPEFTSLSAGQQALVLRNLNQYSVQQIQGEALKHYREKIESLATPLSKEQQTYLSERVSTLRTWWRRFAVAVEQIAKKETWKRAGMNLMKDKWLADEEKQLAAKLSSEGAPDRVELVRSLALLAKEGPDAEMDERGGLRLKFVSERDFGGDLSEDERGRIHAFNTAAQAFMEAKKPDLSGAELDQAVSGKVNKVLDSVNAFVTGRAAHEGAEKQKFAEAKAAYEKALHDMLELKRMKTGDDAAVMDTLEIDRAIAFNQYFNTNPGAERMLADIKDQSSWMRWAKSSSRLRLGSFAVGGATRVVAAGTLATLGGGAIAGLVAAPLAGYGVGRMMGRQRARTELEEKELLAKMGVAERERASRERIAAIKGELAQIPEDTKDPTANARRIALARELGTVAFEADKTSRHIVHAGQLAEKITKLEDRLVAIDEAIANGAEKTPALAKERDLVVRRLDARYAFAKEKIDKGLIDFGSRGAEGVANQYRLFKALGSAAATASVEQQWNSNLKDRLAKFLSYSDKAVTARQAEFLDTRGKQAAKIGAAFAVAGALATDVAAGAATGRGATAQFLGLGEDEGTTPAELAPEILAAIRMSRSAEGIKEIPGMLETLPEEQVRAIQSEMLPGEIRGIAGSPEVVFKMPNGNLSNAASLEIARGAIKQMEEEARAAAAVSAAAVPPAAPAVDAVTSASARVSAPVPVAEVPTAPAVPSGPTELERSTIGAFQAETPAAAPTELERSTMDAFKTESPAGAPTELERSTLEATSAEIPVEGRIAKTEGEMLEQFRADSAEAAAPAPIAAAATERAPIPAYTIASGDELENILRTQVPEIAELPNRAAQLNAIHNLLGKMKPEELQALGITTDGKYGIQAGNNLDLNTFRSALFDPERTVRGQSILDRARAFGSLKTSSGSAAVEAYTASPGAGAASAPAAPLAQSVEGAGFDVRSWSELAPDAKQAMAGKIASERFVNEDMPKIFSTDTGSLSPRAEALASTPAARVLNLQKDSALRFLDAEAHEYSLAMQAYAKKYFEERGLTGDAIPAANEGETFRQYMERLYAEELVRSRNTEAAKLAPAPTSVPAEQAVPDAGPSASDAVPETPEPKPTPEVAPAPAKPEALSQEGEKLLHRAIETDRNMLGSSSRKSVAAVLADPELAKRTNLAARLSEMRKLGYTYDERDNVLLVLEKGYRHSIAVEEASGAPLPTAARPTESAPRAVRTPARSAPPAVYEPVSGASSGRSAPNIGYEPVSQPTSRSSQMEMGRSALAVYEPVSAPERADQGPLGDAARVLQLGQVVANPKAAIPSLAEMLRRGGI